MTAMDPSDGTPGIARGARATKWQLRTRLLRFGRLPQLMGIVNVTPDSFSDGGQFLDPQAAVEHALQLVADGADLLDVGGESTRPYSQPVSPDEELRRVIPVIERLAQRTDVPISVDTSKSIVAQRAIEAGAEIINDVTGFEDPRMIQVASDTGAGLCAMHMKGTPQTMQEDPRYGNVVEDVLRYLNERKCQLTGAGIDVKRICLDPGIGFGKTHEHNWQLIEQASRFHATGCPILVGHSRKGFIAKRWEDPDRGTAIVSGQLAAQGVQILRVHNVRLNRSESRSWRRPR